MPRTDTSFFQLKKNTKTMQAFLKSFKELIFVLFTRMYLINLVNLNNMNKKLQQQ